MSIGVIQVLAKVEGCWSSELVIWCVYVSMAWRVELLTGRCPGSSYISSDPGDNAQARAAKAHPVRGGGEGAFGALREPE
jgi:hypothetical protein